MAAKLFMNVEGQFEDFCNNANDLMQSVTPKASFRWVNNAWLKNLGYKKEEITDMTIFDIIHPDELEHCQGLFRRVISGEDIGVFTTIFITKDGKSIAEILPVKNHTQGWKRKSNKVKLPPGITAQAYVEEERNL